MEVYYIINNGGCVLVTESKWERCKHNNLSEMVGLQTVAGPVMYSRFAPSSISLSFTILVLSLVLSLQIDSLFTQFVKFRLCSECVPL
jgi:hypothetical protein